ncbi:MAG: hypothetical protein MRJ93_03220 [Nitrososphaeraceae archaeon]|nr:hypothetical protein [Nitrososphaeraceae archaeon]
MLDTNALDYIYNNQVGLGSKLTKPNGKILNFYITYVQRFEINKIADIHKKNSINKILNQMRIRTILPSEIVGYLKSDLINCDESRNEIKEIPFDPIVLKKIFGYNSYKKCNFADLLILHTAIKNKMDFLITDNISDFKILLERFFVILHSSLQLKKNVELDSLFNCYE